MRRLLLFRGLFLCQFLVGLLVFRSVVAEHEPTEWVPAVMLEHEPAQMPLALIAAVAPETPEVEELSTRAAIFSVGRSQFAA